MKLLNESNTLSDEVHLFQMHRRYTRFGGYLVAKHIQNSNLNCRLLAAARK